MYLENIKTEKLIVDTTFLIDSIAKLKSTQARPAFFEMDRDYKLVSEAPAGSQLFRLFHSRLKRGNGFLKKLSFLSAGLRPLKTFTRCLKWIRQVITAL